jgi:hypothetical protein
VHDASTRPAPPAHGDLVARICRSTGLPPGVAARVVADVLAYFSESTQEFVRRRHGELKQRGHDNDAIFARVAEELQERRVAAPELSVRQLRRLIYG